MMGRRWGRRWKRCWGIGGSGLIGVGGTRWSIDCLGGCCGYEASGNGEDIGVVGGRYMDESPPSLTEDVSLGEIAESAE